MNFGKSNLVLFFLIAIFLTSSFNCKDKDEYVPYVWVDFYAYLSDPEFVDLNAIGNYVNVTGGYKGIVLYRKSIDEFVAYDRACAYDPLKECERVNVDETNLYLICPCCNSKFSILDGSVVNSPATKPLKMYQCTFDGNAIHVFN
jgi:nitrite reductase/ring-hydroxylating ferredoxin subunit